MNRTDLLDAIEQVLIKGEKEIMDGHIRGCVILIRSRKATEVEVW